MGREYDKGGSFAITHFLLSQDHNFKIRELQHFLWRLKESELHEKLHLFQDGSSNLLQSFLLLIMNIFNIDIKLISMINIFNNEYSKVEIL